MRSLVGQGLTPVRHRRLAVCALRCRTQTWPSRSPADFDPGGRTGLCDHSATNVTEPLRLQWASWARAAVGDEAAGPATDAALAALKAGATADEAAAAARIACARELPGDTGLLQAAQLEIAYALRALRRVQASAELTEAGIAALRHQLEAGAAALALPSTASGGTAAARGRGEAASPARASMLEFLADNSIQLLAYSGAFLLAVAVLLFDLSGTSPARFWAVAGLNAVFATGGWVAFRRPAIRVVALAYVALAALLLPLTGLAAYIFLQLGPLGVSPSVAATVVAGSCTVAYTLLAVSMGSSAYAALSVCALAVAAGAATDATHQTRWIAVSLAALTPLLALVAQLDHPRLKFFRTPAEIGTYASAALGVLWATAAAAGDPRHWPLTAALVLVSIAAVIRAGLPRRRLDLAWLAVTPFPAAVLSLGDSLALGPVEQRSLMLAMALAAVLVTWAFAPPLNPLNREYLRATAAVLVSLAALVFDSSIAVQVGVLSAATAIGLLLTFTAGRGGWLLLPAATFTYCWYWLVKAAVPPPTPPSATDLARAYGPLAILLMACALVARWRGGRRWAWPLYSAAALVGCGTVAIAATAQAWQLAGIWLLVYAALVYAAGVVERSPWAVGAAVLTGTGGLALLLLGAGSEAWAQVLALSGAGLVTFGAGIATRLVNRLAFAETFQCALGLALALLAALAGIASLGTGTRDIAAVAVAAMVATLVLAADGVLHRRRLSVLGAPIAASLLGPCAARLSEHLGVWPGAGPMWQVLVPAVVLVWTGIRAGADDRLPARIALARTLAAAGALLLFGTTAFLAWNGSAADVDPRYTGWLAVQGAAGLAAAVYGRSRALAVCSACALAAAALLSAFLLAQATSLSVTFGVVAVALMFLATLLALFRGRLAAGPGLTRGTWQRWV